MTPARLPRPARVFRIGLAVLGPTLLVGCGGDKVVAAPKLSGKTAETCASIVRALPESILGVSQHDNVPGVQVQWGSPSLVLTCGVEQSTEVEDWSACAEFDGVQWYIPPQQAENPESDVTIETLGTDPIVQVHVPLDVRPQFDSVVGELAPALTAHLRVINKCD